MWCNISLRVAENPVNHSGNEVIEGSIAVLEYWSDVGESFVALAHQRFNDSTLIS